MPQKTVKKSGIREVAGEYQVASEFYDALDELIHEEIERAKERAEANRRKTLKPQDI